MKIFFDFIITYTNLGIIISIISTIFKYVKFWENTNFVRYNIVRNIIFLNQLHVKFILVKHFFNVYVNFSNKFLLLLVLLETFIYSTLIFHMLLICMYFIVLKLKYRIERETMCNNNLN